jgi:hypothetical protein
LDTTETASQQASLASSSQEGTLEYGDESTSIESAIEYLSYEDSHTPDNSVVYHQEEYLTDEDLLEWLTAAGQEASAEEARELLEDIREAERHGRHHSGRDRHSGQEQHRTTSP